jgi:hypothetical protein
MESFFTQSATINRPSVAQDAGGYPLPTFSELATGVLCRIEEVRGFEAIRYQRETNAKLYRGLFPKSQDIDPKDQVVMGGLTFNVLNVRDFVGVDGLATGVETDLERTI